MAVEWREVLRLVSVLDQSMTLFKEAYELFRKADEENRLDVMEDTVKQRRQLQQYLLEGLEYHMITRRDLDVIEEDIDSGGHTVRPPIFWSFCHWLLCVVVFR